MLLQVAPWDWSGILLARVIHEAAFLSLVTVSEQEQRRVLEQFIDEVFSQNRRNLLLAKPPLVYKEMIEVASSVVRTCNGKHGDLWRNLDVYGAYRTVKLKESELEKKRTEIQNLKNRGRPVPHGSGFSDEGGSVRRRNSGEGVDRERGRGKQPSHQPPHQETPEEKDYVLDRLEVCREWNSRDGCKRGHCRKSHVCKRQREPGKCCKGAHHASKHQ